MAQDWLGTPYHLRGKSIWVAGYLGMVGSAVVRALAPDGAHIVKPQKRIDLRAQASVIEWMQGARPQVVVLAAAKVGGIEANRTHPAEFIYDNLMIEANIIHGAYEAGVEKLVFLGSSCIYPRDAAQPITEEALLTGPLEPTNEAYALAKIAGIKMCQSYRAQYGCDFISVMPCNLYGPGDTYSLARSHVIPALILKALEAKSSGAASWSVWGSGAPLREFLHVDDLAAAIVFALKHYSSATPLNIGSGEEVSIRKLAEMVAALTGCNAALEFDTSKPDGTPRKLMDSSRIRAAGWAPRISLRQGLEMTLAAVSDSLRA